MKSRAKNLHPKFNSFSSGYLLFSQSSARTLLSINTDEIRFLRKCYHDNTHIYLAADKSREIQANFMLVNYFWQRSRMTGESFDLRPMCSLPQSDALYSVYRKPDLDIHAKKDLASRVKRLNPMEIY